MHFVVHWEYQPSPGLAPAGLSAAETIQHEFEAVLKPYSWVRPLTNFFVVNVPTLAVYQTVASALNAIPKKYPNQVFLIISPPMVGGLYQGFLPQTLWTELNIRSN